MSVEDTEMERLFAAHELKEKIYRFDEEIEFPLLPPAKKPKPSYPWEQGIVEPLLPIRNEDFSCRGRKNNYDRILLHAAQQEELFTDCGGHSSQQVAVNPTLLEILNHIQKVTGKQVVVTSGVRCPKHHAYLRPSGSSASSLYLIGAACDFYVRGYEKNPGAIVRVIQDYYRSRSRALKDEALGIFHRIPLHQSLTVSPWMNKEVCIVLHTEEEGRNPDNAHDYSYVSLLVHYDLTAKKPMESFLQERLSEVHIK